MLGQLKCKLKAYPRVSLAIRLIRAPAHAWKRALSEHRGERTRLKLQEIQRQAIEAYESHSRVRKLHIGAGTNILPGWLNTDLEPTSDDILFLDASTAFPISDQTFDYVFSEHMLEHLTYKDGLSLLREISRILKPGGKVRIATPDVEKIVGLFTPNKTQLQRRYIEWNATEQMGLYSESLTKLQMRRPEWAIPPEHIRRRFPDRGRDSVCFIVNNFFRSYGHQFLYDAMTLGRAMEDSGLAWVKQFDPGESDDEALRGLESHGSLIGDEMNKFETMVLEGTRL